MQFHHHYHHPINALVHTIKSLFIPVVMCRMDFHSDGFALSAGSVCEALKSNVEEEKDEEDFCSFHLLEYFSPIYFMEAVGGCVGKTVLPSTVFPKHNQRKRGNKNQINLALGRLEHCNKFSALVVNVVIEIQCNGRNKCFSVREAEECLCLSDCLYVSASVFVCLVEYVSGVPFSSSYFTQEKKRSSRVGPVHRGRNFVKILLREGRTGDTFTY